MSEFLGVWKRVSDATQPIYMREPMSQSRAHHPPNQDLDLDPGLDFKSHQNMIQSHMQPIKIHRRGKMKDFISYLFPFLMFYLLNS